MVNHSIPITTAPIRPNKLAPPATSALRHAAPFDAEACGADPELSAAPPFDAPVALITALGAAPPAYAPAAAGVEAPSVESVAAPVSPNWPVGRGSCEVVVGRPA